jgi:Alkylmercury lyase
MNSVRTAAEKALSLIHHESIQGLIDTGNCPTRTELAERLDTSVAEIEQLLSELSETHGIVLHPHVCEPWVVHPFSTTPTAHWVEGPKGSWWAPCIWCAFGIATVVGGETQIHTRIGAEREPLVIQAVQGQPVGLEDMWVHFAIPPARAWQNVHQHCSMVLAFHSREDIVAWCDRHRLPHGEDVPLRQVAGLAQAWYHTYADRDWHKWTIVEAQEIFRRSGLVSPFWDLGQKDGRY